MSNRDPKRSKAALRWQEMGRRALEAGPTLMVEEWVRVFFAEQRRPPAPRRSRPYPIPRATA